MKTLPMILIPVLALGAPGRAQSGGAEVVFPSTGVVNQITTNQNQNTTASGGEASSDSRSNSNASLTSTSVSNYDTRTPPLTTFPPYLPYWNHGGWGTIKAYFPNGPTANDQVYETTFDPENPADQHELRSVLKALPHKGFLQAVGGVLNDVAVAMFDKPNTYFHGRGIEIADSIVRDRRPEGKSLLVFIDSNVDTNLLSEEGYVYVGKVSVEADPDRNWDQGYKAAVAEALLWDVDILLISGGMKGVTTGSNTTFPSAAAGYSQVNYSLSLLGSKAKGITEGKGKAMLSAEAYRYNPQAVERRRIPSAIYDRIRYRPQPAALGDATCPSATGETVPPVPLEEWAPADLRDPQAAPAVMNPASSRSSAAPAALGFAPAATPARGLAGTPPRRTEPRRPAYEGPGITVSRELMDMAGFPSDQQVGYVNIR
jgi:hypothetical protein